MEGLATMTSNVAPTVGYYVQAGSVYNVALHHFPPSVHHLTPISLPYPHTPVSSPTASPLQGGLAHVL